MFHDTLLEHWAGLSAWKIWTKFLRDPPIVWQISQCTLEKIHFDAVQELRIHTKIQFLRIRWHQHSHISLAFRGFQFWSPSARSTSLIHRVLGRKPRINMWYSILCLVELSPTSTFPPDILKHLCPFSLISSWNSTPAVLYDGNLISRVSFFGPKKIQTRQFFFFVHFIGIWRRRARKQKHST